MNTKIIITFIIFFFLSNFNCNRKYLIVNNSMSLDIHFCIINSNFKKIEDLNFEFIRQHDSIIYYSIGALAFKNDYKNILYTFKIDSNFKGTALQFKKNNFDKLIYKKFDITKNCKENGEIKTIDIYDNKVIIK